MEAELLVSCQRCGLSRVWVFPLSAASLLHLRAMWCLSRVVVGASSRVIVTSRVVVTMQSGRSDQLQSGRSDQSGRGDQSGRSDQARRLAADIDVPEDSPFVVSEGLPPVPGKLVKKILKGDFVDMAELLRDNLEADRRVQGREAKNADGSTSRLASRREVPDLLSWVQCFGVYVCVVASRHPGRIRQLLAYQTLIVREARRLGGKGWQAYDSLFRQQAAVSSMDWSKLNSTLYAMTFLAQQGVQKVRSCLLCLESDHAWRGRVFFGAGTTGVGGFQR